MGGIVSKEAARAHREVRSVVRWPGGCESLIAVVAVGICPYGCEGLAVAKTVGVVCMALRAWRLRGPWV